MPDWSIKIVGSGNATSFAPKAQQAQQDDLVSWNNTTNETHQPWPLDGNGNPIKSPSPGEYLSDPIPPGRSSRPAYNVAQPATSPPPDSWTVSYYCKNHPNRPSERGTIVASVPPDVNS
jgi:hypothetical protein